MTNSVLVSAAHVLPEGQRGLKPARRGAAVAGVVALVVIAVVAIGAWVADRDDSAAGEALFVLPVPVGDWRLSDGAVTEPVPDPDAPATDQRFIADGSLYGVADDNGYVGLRSIVHYPASPLPGARWEPAVTTTSGEAYRRVDDSMTFAEQEFDGRWRVASSPSDLVHAYGMLSNDTTGLVLVAVFAPSGAPETAMTSFVMTAPGGSTLTVETAAGSPLFDAATHAERIEPVDINGTPGWVVTGEGEDASSTVVTWSPETGRAVSVRGSAPRDAVVDGARQLRAVSAAEWTSSFPEPAGG